MHVVFIGKNTEMRRDIVVPKLAEIAQVVWVHPQSELVSFLIII